jgi:DNA-binding MarR family transcriptional regulator
MGDRDLEAGRALTIVGLGRVVELAVRETGLSSAKFRALSCVNIGVSASGLIARFLDVTPSTVTSVMDGLVADGLVVRATGVNDRRRLDHQLTAAGRQTLDAANAVAAQALSELAGYVDPADSDVAFSGLDTWARAIESRRDQWSNGKREPDES